MKNQELAEIQRELKTTKSALARVAMSPKQPTRLAPGQSVAPTPSGSSDEQALDEAPAFKEMRRQNFYATLRMIYEPLLTQLNLSPDQRTRFYELRLNGLENPAANAEEELRKLFGPRGFELYQSYASTEGERQLLLQFRQQVDAKSLQVANWQYDRLLAALVQARQQYPRNAGGRAAAYEAALSQAPQFLTPDQLEAARSYFHNQAEVLKTIQAMLPPPK